VAPPADVLAAPVVIDGCSLSPPFFIPDLEVARPSAVCSARSLFVPSWLWRAMRQDPSPSAPCLGHLYLPMNLRPFSFPRDGESLSPCFVPSYSDPSPSLQPRGMRDGRCVPFHRRSSTLAVDQNGSLKGPTQGSRGPRGPMISMLVPPFPDDGVVPEVRRPHSNPRTVTRITSK